MNRLIFEASVETQLAPTLSTGDVVTLDNLARPQKRQGRRRHQGSRCMDALLAALQSRSPSGNGLVKLKAHSGRAIRTIDGVWQAIGDICSLYPQTECQKYLKAAGYA